MLTEFASEFLGDRRAVPSLNTEKTYRHGIWQFVGYLQSIGKPNSIRSLNDENVDGFARFMLERRKPATVILRLAALSALATYGMKVKRNGKYVFDENPVTRIFKPKLKRPAHRYLTLPELQALVQAEGPANETLAVMILADTPVRATELCEARVRHLTPREDGSLLLDLTVKGGRDRSKVLGALVAARLLASLREREAGPEDRLVVNRCSKPYDRNSLSEMIMRRARRIGITRFPVRAHVIRHSIATLAGKNGASLFEIADMLNHSNTATVHRYTHVEADPALLKTRALLFGAA